MELKRINVELERQEKNKAGNAKQPNQSINLSFYTYFIIRFEFVVDL